MDWFKLDGKSRTSTALKIGWLNVNMYTNGKFKSHTYHMHDKIFTRMLLCIVLCINNTIHHYTIYYEVHYVFLICILL